MKKLRKHPQAERDIADAIARYGKEGLALSDRFPRKIELALARIRNMPRSGSPRFSHDVGLPELRAVSLSGFPYLLFYLDREESIDLIRVLHSDWDTFNILLGSG